MRLAAIQLENRLTDRLGDEWLVMLAEILPFVSELFEDDDTAVEREGRKWVKNVEAILGENLDLR